MQKNCAKDIINPQWLGLIVGIGLMAGTWLLGILIPAVIIIVYFLVGLIFGYFWPNFSWKIGLWITLPWIVYICVGGFTFVLGIIIDMGMFFLVLILSVIFILLTCIGAYIGAKHLGGKKIPKA